MTTSSTVLRSVAASVCLLLGVQQLSGRAPQPEPTAAGTTTAPATPQDGAPRLTPEQLDDLLAPIALYPDPLIAQILPASTYPLEVVQAARWVRDHADLQGLDDQDWDPSVQAVAHYPSVLTMMDENLAWTIRLGRAFLDQPQGVMDSVQQLRVKARTVGTLIDTPQQRVIAEQEVIRIVPAEPEVIYVPVYNPAVVYAEPYPAYYAAPYVTFGVGFALGWWLDLDCDWHHRHVYYRHWHPHHYDGDHGRPGPGYPPHPSGGPRHPGRDGDVWRRDPRREPPPVTRPRASFPGAPTDDARGRLSRSPGVPGRGVSPGRLSPSPAPGATPLPTPDARRGQPPAAGPATGPTTRPTTRPSPSLQAPRPTPDAFRGYQRGTQSQLNSRRGQSSRGASSPSMPPRPSSAPSPAMRSPARAPSPMRPTAAPRPTAGVLGGYQPGRAAATSSQRGRASRAGPGRR